MQVHGSLCIPDGCHAFTITNTTDTTATAATSSTGSSGSGSGSASGSGEAQTQGQAVWFMCGQRGTVPWTAQLCVEATYGLCYGLNGCPFLKSYVHRSSNQQFLLSHIDSTTGARTYDTLGNSHGITDLCKLKENTEYQFDLGFGSHLLADSDSDRWHLCGASGTYPASGTLTLQSSDNSATASGSGSESKSESESEGGGEGCVITSTTPLQCESELVPQLVGLLDLYGT